MDPFGTAAPTPWEEPPAPPDYLVGLDLGRQQDHTALSVLERTERPAAGAPVAGPPSFVERLGLGRRPDPVPIEGHYGAVHLERYELGCPYPKQVAQTVATLARLRDGLPAPPRFAPARRSRIVLVVDGTGVGTAVVDLLRAADLAGAQLVPVVIHGGEAVSIGDGGAWRVPKRLLASHLQVALQTRRLRVAGQLPEAATLVAELRNFRVKVSLGGHDAYGAGEDWRQGNHDDVVLAVALALWYGEHGIAGSESLGAVFGRAASWVSGRE